MTAHVQVIKLKRHGPICQVILKPSYPTIGQLKSKKKKVPSVSVSALIDTGASHTAVSGDVVKRLGLVPRGSVQVHTSHRSAEMRNEYDISLKINHTCIEVVRALEANFPNHRIDCLIGRDILQHCVFTYDGPKKEMRLSF
jgi:predicted aspartyl protease